MPQPVTRTVVDTDLTLVKGSWRFCGEVNYGDVSAAGNDAQWLGLLLMGHVDFSDKAGLTVRLDQLDDQDGYLFGAVDAAFQTRRSLSLAPTFVLDDGLGALAELRLDSSDRVAVATRRLRPTAPSRSPWR